MPCRAVPIPPIPTAAPPPHPPTASDVEATNFRKSDAGVGVGTSASAARPPNTSRAPRRARMQQMAQPGPLPPLAWTTAWRLSGWRAAWLDGWEELSCAAGCVFGRGEGAGRKAREGRDEAACMHACCWSEARGLLPAVPCWAVVSWGCVSGMESCVGCRTFARRTRKTRVSELVHGMRSKPTPKGHLCVQT
eukprot:365808-Chlamydomonas_euryale.AAC.9